MPINTFFGNLNEQVHGASVVKVAAGKCLVGKPIEMTAGEVTLLTASGADIRLGTVARNRSTTPFAWGEDKGHG